MEELEEQISKALAPPSEHKSWRPLQILQRSPPRREASRSPVDQELDRMERDVHDNGAPPEQEELPPREAKKQTADPYPLRDSQGPYRLARGWSWFKERPPDIAVVSAHAFLLSADKSHMGVTSLYEIDRFIEDKQKEERHKDLQDDEEELRQKVLRQVLTLPEYHEYLDVFSKAESDQLSSFRPRHYHKIELLEGSRPEDLGFSPLYRMTADELEACRKYITENLHKGFIESSDAPWAAPILFAPKANGGLRFCVDYRKLNAITKKDQYPLPLIDETLSRLAKAKIFTKIDIRQAFHKIRLEPDAIDLTTFRTRYGAYKYKVLPFGLTNGPATFQRFINEILMGYLDQFASAYIDDILIYSDNLDEHKIHVKKILAKLREAGLQADIDKCEFHVENTKYLGFIVGTDGLKFDPQKIEAVEDWKTPESVRGVQSFLGFCNFYRRFVKDYGRVARPLNNLTRKGEAFSWTTKCQTAFEEHKVRLLTAPVLTHFHHDRETRVETDSSDGVVAGVLSQLVDGEWHPVSYFSETMHGAEMNYPIHDKELLAVIRALVYWRSELMGLKLPFSVITDHEALKYFSTKRLLNVRQAGWAELMSQCNFTITYRPGRDNVAADALTRKSEDLTTLKARKEAHRTIQIFRQISEPGEEDKHITADAANPVDTTPMICILGDDAEPAEASGVLLMDQILEANRRDESLEEFRERARRGDDTFHITNGLLTRFGKLVVPDVDLLCTKLIREVHGRLTTAHPGRSKTSRMLRDRYWWPGLVKDSDQYVDNCMDCRPAKAPRDKTPGLLKPIPPPLRGCAAWWWISTRCQRTARDSITCSS